MTENVLLDCRRVDAYPDRLGQDDHVAGRCPAIAPDLARRADAGNSQAVNGLRTIDRVTAGNGNARRRAGGVAAAQDVANDVSGEFAKGHAEDGERHYWARAHRIDIGNGVRCSDAPEVNGIVDDRHEEIRCGDDARARVELPDRCVIAGFGANYELCKRRRSGLICEKLLQNRRSQLAPTTPTMCQAGQPDLRPAHFYLLLHLSLE